MKDSVKPIFAVGVPSLGSGDQTRLTEALGLKLKDYHVLVYKTRQKDVVFNAFYPSDFKELSLEEFKKIVNNELKQNK